MTAEDSNAKVAYVPFKTFLAAIEGFERNMPTQIDTSVWPSYSGAIKGQLLGAFKFLKLIDDKGHPTNALKTLVIEKTNRKSLLRQILAASYTPVVSAGLPNMTPKMFEQLMSTYGMTGETHKKVTAFFLKAAQYADLQMSPLLIQRAPYTRRKKDNDGREELDVPIPQGQTQLGTSKTIDLKSGGKLTLILSVNVFDLSPTDREFVFGMIDKLQGYEGKKE